MRVSGLSSGLDTESIVQSLVALEQLKIDDQTKLITQIEWKSDALRDVNLLLKNFREKYMSVLSPDTNMLTGKAYSSFETTMLDTTNAVTVQSSYASTAGTMTINNITQLATAAKTEGLSIFNTDTNSFDTALKDLDLATPLTFDAGEISFSINAETFTFTEDSTLSDVINTVNASDAGVSMSYSSLKKGLTILSDETGAASTIEIVNIKGNAFDATSSALGMAEGTYTGQDAMLEIENIAVTRSSNSFTIDGNTYNLRNTTATSVSFMVERSVQNTVDKITGFVDAYNELIGGLQEKVDEPAYRTYEPLIDSERENLSETQQEKWEEMAKSGILRNDSNVTGLLATLRTSFYTAVESAGLSPAEIGLTTGAYANKGKIFINEEVLTKAIQENPAKVESIFVSMSDSTDGATKFNESGLINRMSTLFTDYVSNANYNTIANNESSLSRAESRLTALKDSLERNEERYWAKYTAMETALATMNSQISSLLSGLGYGAE